MRAARFYGPGDIRVEDTPEPVPKEGQVKVKVATFLWKKIRFITSVISCKDCLVCSRRPPPSVFMDSKLENCRNGSEWLLDSAPFKDYNYPSMRQRPSRLSSPSIRICKTGTQLYHRRNDPGYPRSWVRSWVTCQRTKISESRFSGTIVELGTGVDSKRWVVGTNVVMWVGYSIRYMRFWAPWNQRTYPVVS